MSARQLVAIVAAPLVVVSMTPLFSWTGNRLGQELGWYAGFPAYWGLWCIALPLALVGWKGVRGTLGRARMSSVDWCLVGLPPLVSLVGRVVGSSGTDRVGPWLATQSRMGRWRKSCGGVRTWRYSLGGGSGA